MTIVHEILSWLANAPALVQITFLVCASVVSIFAFSDQSIHGKAQAFIDALRGRK